MVEEIEDWKEYHTERDAKRKNNQKSSVQILKERKIAFEVMNEGNGHYRVGEYDIWVSTGKFVHRKNQVWGRGIFNLLKLIT